MKKTVNLLNVVFCLLAVGTASGQGSTYSFTLQTLGGYTTPDVVPFWLRSNQFGSIPLDGASLSFIGAARKDYDLSGDKLFDWGASFEGRANLGHGSNLTLIEGYGKVRLGIFELRAGRSKKITGLCDTTLTSGSWVISGTNLGIPEVELSVRDFWTLPILGHLFAFKGNFAHGWMGEMRMARFILLDTVTATSYLHQKSLYGRFGKPSWRFKLYGGFNHQVVWGDEKDYYLDDYTLTPAQTYYYVITGKRFSNGYIQQERQGNHLGSIDVGLEYKFDGTKLLLYRQNFYETGALANFANIRDGLTGISILNHKNNDRYLRINAVIFEMLYTKNQAGLPTSPPTASSYEGYFNHGQYLQGWSYWSIGIGSPFISSRKYTLSSLPSAPQQHFINNRVIVYHTAMNGSFADFGYLIKLSWSRNFGTYWTTDEEQTTDIPNPGEYGIFGEHKQLSGYLELSRVLNRGYSLSLIGAFDLGELYYDSIGVFLKASYSFK